MNLRLPRSLETLFGNARIEISGDGVGGRVGLAAPMFVTFGK